MRQGGLAKSAVHDTDTISLIGQYVCSNVHKVSLADGNPSKGFFPAYVQHELVKRSHGIGPFSSPQRPLFLFPAGRLVAMDSTAQAI